MSEYNPDVLTCLANLSNDEVFTPPNIVNEILDCYPDELWRSPSSRFLEPATKSGVFLREIAKRLINGLSDEIPNFDKRIEHIFSNQLFGIAITELTALMSRRSVYCSKSADGKYSITKAFDSSAGNIIFNNPNHTFKNGKCVFCGVTETLYARDSDREQHAYEFLHTDDPKSIFNMKFDVIIGNPPYQLNDGGGMGTSAMPLYQKFVEQAKTLNPRYLSMIIPARWYSGGKGLDDFRLEMLSDKRISKLVDYFDSTMCFPGVDISGGVCYFLWERDYSGDCEVTNISRDKTITLKRSLLETGTQSFIRFNEAISIVKKIRNLGEKSFQEIVSARKPFGFSNPQRAGKESTTNTVKVYAYPQTVFTKKSEVTQNIEALDKYKVFIAKAYGERGGFPYNVLGKPFIGEPASCCSETYLLINSDGKKRSAESVKKYISTRFFRFLVLLKKNTQNAPRGVYEFVPIQDFSEEWTDEKLYKKYGLSDVEIEYLEGLVKPMEL